MTTIQEEIDHLWNYVRNNGFFKSQGAISRIIILTRYQKALQAGALPVKQPKFMRYEPK